MTSLNTQLQASADGRRVGHKGRSGAPVGAACCMRTQEYRPHNTNSLAETNNNPGDSPELEELEMRLSAIVLDESIRCRHRLDEARIDKLAEAMRRHEVLPAVEVFGTAERAWLADGWHRVMAARKLGATSIAVRLHPGTRTDAVRLALMANQAEHGRSLADERRCVEVALREFPQASDATIAEMSGIRVESVARYREESRGRRAPDGWGSDDADDDAASFGAGA